MTKQLQIVWKLKQSGLSNRKIALQIGVSHTLINQWLKEYPLFEGKNTPDKHRKKVSTTKKAWKPNLETLETNMEIAKKKEKNLNLPSVSPVPAFVSTPLKVETPAEKPIPPKEDLDLTVKNVFAQYKYREYCKEMDSKLSAILDTVLSLNGKYIAKKRVEDLLYESNKNSFERNFNFNEASVNYPYNALFKKLIYQLKDVVKAHINSYQIILKIDNEDLKKMKQVLYELENQPSLN